MKNVMEKIEAFRGKANPRYDLNYHRTLEICQNNPDSVAAVCDAFVFGYMQRQKSAKAEMKKAQSIEKTKAKALKSEAGIVA